MTDSQNSADAVRYAGFWVRVGALLLDQLLVGLLLIPILMILYGFDGLEKLAEDEDEFLAVGWIVGFAYIILLTATDKFRGTLGKYLLRIAVVNQRYEPISLLHSLWRALMLIVTFFVAILTLGIPFFIAGWTKKKCALHDYLSNTYVVWR